MLERILSLLGFIPNNFTIWEQKFNQPWKAITYINLTLAVIFFLDNITNFDTLNQEYEKVRWVNVCLSKTTMAIESFAIVYHVYHIKIKGSPHLKSTFGHKFKKPKLFQYFIFILCFLYKWAHLYYYAYVLERDLNIVYIFAAKIVHTGSFIILAIYSFMIADVTGRLEETNRTLNGENAIPLTDEHRHLCALLTSINETFSLQIFAIFLKYSVHATRKSYRLFLYWLDCSHEGYCGVIFSIDSTVWILWNYIVIAFLVYLCENARKMVDIFNTKLFFLMQETEILRKNEKLFMYVLMKPSVNFTACGFFTIGYPFIGSIIAATVTYLAILIQFSITGSCK